jgi:nicotinate phosphoribosyltransferase
MVQKYYNHKDYNSLKFGHPLEKIKSGWYSDKYFVRTKEIFSFLNRHPIVIMQIFTKKRGIFCGGIESARVIRECSDDGKSLIIKGLGEGEKFRPWETVMTIEGDYQKFAHLETVYLGILARCSSIATNVRKVVSAASGKPVLFFSARFDHYLVQEIDGYSAFVGGVSGVSTDANGFIFNKEGTGTIPHGLIAAFDGNTEKASVAFDKYVSEDVKRIALVDFDNNCVETSLKVARKLKKKLFAVRLDTAENIVDFSLQKKGISKEGVCEELVWEVRKALDKEGFDYVKIVISGGFTPTKIRRFIKSNVPFDIVGVGSYFYRNRIDFTADIVMVDGRPIAKVGRKYNPNPRLKEIE